MASYQSAWCGYYPNMIPYLTGQPFGYPFYSQNITQPVFYNCQSETSLTTACQSENRFTTAYNIVPTSHCQMSMNPAPYCTLPVPRQYLDQSTSFLLPKPAAISPPQFESRRLKISQNGTKFRKKLSNESGSCRLLIQGSRISYVSPSSLSTSFHHINGSQQKLGNQPEDAARESDCSADCQANPFKTAEHTEGELNPTSYSNNPHLKVDFSNLDLLSSVSLFQTVTSPSETPETQTVTSPTETPETPSQNKLPKGILCGKEEFCYPDADVSLHQASAVGLVSLSLIRKPTVWLNVTLQIDTGSSVKSDQPTTQYRSLMTNILTQLYFPPKITPPDHLHSDSIGATASYDDRGRLTVLEVEFVTPGIYKVQSTSDNNTGHRKSSKKSVTLTRLESLENFVSNSQYFILGELSPIPKTFFKCHRNAQPLQKKISEYLYSREFRKHTLPLLLKNGEEDVWTNRLKVPRTRSRVSDYDDLANGDQSLKRKHSTKTLLPRKGRKLTRASSVTSVCTSSPESSDQSAVNSPCPSPSSSVSSLSSFQMSDDFCEDSCDSVTSNHSDPPVLIKEVSIEIAVAAVMASPPRLKPVTTSMLTRSQQRRRDKTSNKL